MILRRTLYVALGVAAVSLPFGSPTVDDTPVDTPQPREQRQAAPQKKAVVRASEVAEEKKEEPAVTTFRLPDDAGGRLVSRVLAPTDRPFEQERRMPSVKKSSRQIENPTAPLPQQVASLPRLPETAPLRTPPPQLMSPEPLFGLEEVIGSLPQAMSFPAQDRVRIPSSDVAQPVSLPRLAQPLPDRASTTDPTVAASTESALTAPLPDRTAPAPFQRFTLPDPFENHDTVRLKGTPGEETLPDSGTRLPRK